MFVYPRLNSRTAPTRLSSTVLPAGLLAAGRQFFDIVK